MWGTLVDPGGHDAVLRPLASGRVLIALERLQGCSRGSVYPLNLQLRLSRQNATPNLAIRPVTGGLPKWL